MVSDARAETFGRWIWCRFWAANHQRFPSCGAFVEALDQAFFPSAPATRRTTRAKSGVNKTLVVVGAVILAAAATIYLRSPDTERHPVKTGTAYAPSIDNRKADKRSEVGLKTRNTLPAEDGTKLQNDGKRQGEPAEAGTSLISSPEPAAADNSTASLCSNAGRLRYDPGAAPVLQRRSLHWRLPPGVQLRAGQDSENAKPRLAGGVCKSFRSRKGEHLMVLDAVRVSKSPRRSKAGGAFGARCYRPSRVTLTRRSGCFVRAAARIPRIRRRARRSARSNWARGLGW